MIEDVWGLFDGFCFFSTSCFEMLALLVDTPPIEQRNIQRYKLTLPVYILIIVLIVHVNMYIHLSSWQEKAKKAMRINTLTTPRIVSCNNNNVTPLCLSITLTPRPLNYSFSAWSACVRGTTRKLRPRFSPA